MIYYGLASSDQMRDYARVVCDVLGHGSKNNAMKMLVETAAQETHCGRYRDSTPNGAGRGLFQCDKIAFDDIKARVRHVDVYKINSEFGIDIRNIDHEQLDYSPLLAAIFCRLFYKFIPQTFPVTLEGRADYWKRFYNTELGKGTVDEYIENARRYTGEWL